ncbi:purine catabolism regulatory protein [Leifsonia sp. 98AMF]|uniref:PucR family transcriptional regulator n=1 Tax=unclassified Leifsonia TaxID=2663824 RepID=UPI00087C9078|nr:MULTISPECIES: PucR family transcriptional regulator [unclassified Leifsonia]SDH46413.1 purine catabolism regulatory protein [Leifsonia sp. 197AMF]SDI91086.1 purine catabolism regulatory protein [Leifsonia sp. 466MF]SDJ88867.1 purine catabolism regulatory protein [Leifsonia sp. 157MF]SDN94765.1 purine catabolism regulatory protein [Leifsonia sp. 509MF]SEN10745.1 purine catabolism regulatory protein [Leifsonia sp. 467MF]
MPDRRDPHAVRTVRPEGSGGAAQPVVPSSSVLPTVREVLRMEPVAVALPEVLTGRDRLDAPVRWVHVAETAEAARLGSGGELLLATGVGWPADPAALRRLGRVLVDAGVAGLVLELGPLMPSAPAALVQEFQAAGLPFVVLHREARFVAITEAVHSRIIAEQMVALRARDDIHALFTGLSLRGSPADFIVEQAARVLGSPVVLEDTGHRVIAASGLAASGIRAGGPAAGGGPVSGGANTSGEDELADWEQRSRAAHRSGASGWTIVPVEARGMRWGHLVALPGEPHPAGRSNVLEQAAVALALSRLSDRDDDEWTRRSHDALLAALIGRRFSGEGGVTARFEAAGFPLSGRLVAGVAVRLRSGTLPVSAAARAVEAARTAGADAVAGRHPEQPGTLVVAVSARPGRQLTDGLFASIADAVRSVRLDDPAAVVAVGSDARGITGLLSSLEEAVELAAGSAARADARLGRTPHIQRVQHRPLLRLVNALGSDPRLLEHTEQLLRPLIEYDLATGGDLVEVLRAYLSHPGNRTRAAAASHLSRSVFYQRIALIEELLGMDLDDGETVAALHAAVLARGRTAT